MTLPHSVSRSAQHVAPAALVVPTPRVHVSHLGWVLSALVSLGASGGALVGLGSVAQLAYPLVATLVAAVLLLRRCPAAYVEFVLWLWFLSPEVRRIIDWQTGWHPVSYVMVAAPVATLLCLVPALRSVRRMHPSTVVVFGVFGVGLAFGAAVGVVRLGGAAPAADVLQWLPPLSLGLWIANAGPDRRELRVTCTRTAVSAAAVLGLYALVQFLLLPPWDSFWFANAPLASLGQNLPLEVRVWSLLNSPGPLATVLVALMAFCLVSTSRWRWVAFGLGAVGLGLSLVRAAWLGFAVLLAVLGTRMQRTVAAVVTVLAFVLVVLAVAGGPVFSAISDRFDSSVASGSSDVSFSERLTFHVQTLPVVVRDPVGSGLGSSGVATKLGNGGQLGANGDFDGGALQVLFGFGPIVGGAMLVVVIVAAFLAWTRCKDGRRLEKAAAAVVVALVSQLIFGNPFTSVSGVVLWIAFGVVARNRADEADDAAHPDFAAAAPPNVRARRVLRPR